MILKGASRGGGKQLAQHLLSDENEHVTVHEVRGFTVNDVQGAFQDIQAIAKGTKCTKYLYSLSLNPPQNETACIEDFEAAIEKAEETLNLKGQPRVVIFHEKNARRHCHCVWSRIDAQTMKAIPMDFHKKNLNALAKDLYIEHGWKLPKGFIGKGQSDPRNFTLQEWKQAERNGLNPKQIKATLQQCWQQSDDKKGFSQALTQSGFFLARGDRKNVHVAVDWHGEAYGLRQALGVKAKDIKARIGEANQLPTVTATKAIIDKANTEAHKKLKAQMALQHKYEAKPLKKRHEQLQEDHRKSRAKQKQSHETRQAEERAKRKAEYRKGFKGVWDWVIGKNRELKRKHELSQLSADYRDRKEKEALIQTQLSEKQMLQTQLDVMKTRQQKEAMALNADFVKHLKDQTMEDEITHAFTNQPQSQQTKNTTHQNEPRI